MQQFQNTKENVLIRGRSFYHYSERPQTIYFAILYISSVAILALATTSPQSIGKQ